MVMKPILILCLFAFLATLYWVPCTTIYVATPIDTYRPVWMIDHADHVKWSVLGIQWSAIAVVAASTIIAKVFSMANGVINRSPTKLS